MKKKLRLCGQPERGGRNISLSNDGICRDNKSGMCGKIYYLT